MTRVCLLAVALAIAAFSWSAPVGAAGAAACNNTATTDVLPLHGEFGVNHKINMILLPKFELNRLVPNSIVFHIAVPGKAPLELPGTNDALGASFVPDAIGKYFVSARWQLRGCDDRSQISDASAETVSFNVFRERRPAPRFKSSIPVDRASRKAPLFAVDAACPPSTIRITEPLTLTIYWEVGKKTPTHRSRSSSLKLPDGCGGEPSSNPRTVNYKWGLVRGATIGVLPGNTVRVLGEVKSGTKIVGATRVRFVPVEGNRTGFLRDSGKCTGGCVKRIYPY